jgi:asparagine synthase (glutamine-hydrolysing)
MARSRRRAERLFSRDVRAAAANGDVTRELLRSLPDDFSRWSFLAQDQYLEMRTLPAGYILPSQGDRMMMAHSVEGRFPFLDTDVVGLANSLPPPYKLRVLDEKHVLKRVARGLVPPEILERKKQPYRAPDAISFVGGDAPDWVADALSPTALREAGVFDEAAAGLVYRKCASSAWGAPLSNADNMALVGILSTQLLHERLVRRAPDVGPRIELTTTIEA